MVAVDGKARDGGLGADAGGVRAAFVEQRELADAFARPELDVSVARADDRGSFLDEQQSRSRRPRLHQYLTGRALELRHQPGDAVQRLFVQTGEEWDAAELAGAFVESHGPNSLKQR